VTARTKRERQQEEQEKAIAFRQGIMAFKAGSAQGANPFLDDPGKDAQAAAWNRGWASEQMIRSGFNARERQA